jgi:hypothetical protein
MPLRLAVSLARFQLAQAAPGKKIPPVYKLNIRFGNGKLIPRCDFPAGAAPLTLDPQLAKPLDRDKLGPGKRRTAGPEYPWSHCPALWVTGPVELLESSGTPGIAGHYQEARQTVFFETDGALLRRRIHEFRPDERLYLTIRFYGMTATHDRRMQKERAFEMASEGIRAAQLSGFRICAHVVVEAATDLGDVERLLQYLRELDIDGVVVTGMDDTSDATRNKLSAARKLIGSACWARFSALVQRALLAPQPEPGRFLGAPSAALRGSPKPDLAPNSGLPSEEAAI